MKFKSIALCFFLVISSQLSAKQFFTLEHNKKGREYSNVLNQLDPKNGNKIASKQLSNSYKKPTSKLSLNSNKHFFLYTQLDKHEAKIDIIDKSDINQVKNVTINKIHSRVINKYELYTFQFFDENQGHLIFHTGDRKAQNLVVIDVFTGMILHKIPLSKYNNTVSISQDEEYLIINNTAKDILTILKMGTYEEALTSNLGNYREFGIIHDDHLFLTKKQEIKPKFKYWVQSLNLITKKKHNFENESELLPIFAVDPVNDRLLNINKNSKSRKIELYELEGFNQTLLSKYDFKIKPEYMVVDDRHHKLLIKGRGDIATIDLNSFNHSITDLPFDTINHAYNDSGDLLYLKEGSGSEVAVINVSDGQLIERSGTGRPGVKFGQFMASVALAGVGFNYGYFVYFAKYSSTGFLLSHNQSKLYVINSKTNDVTQFNAKDLSGRKALATGKGTFYIHQSEAENAPIWVFSAKRINQINSESFMVTKEIEFESIIGFDPENNEFTIKTENEVLTFAMNNGAIINKWPMSNADLIWSEL